jgi:hypothetical protein
MDSITTAILAALSAGTASGVTEVSKTAITDTYTKLKNLLAHKFGARSDLAQAIDHLEAWPESDSCKELLQEEVIAVNAAQDEEVRAAAQQVLLLVRPQQADLSKFTIQNNAPVQGLIIGDHSTVTQHFGEPPKASKQKE